MRNPALGGRAIEGRKLRCVGEATKRIVWFTAFVAVTASCHAATETVADQDFTQFTLEELLNVNVTSVSKHAEPLRRAASAIYVLSGDDIRRSGVRTVPDALRLVPGLQVYRNNTPNNGQFIVTSRGLGFEKLEVLVDGRSVYQPLDALVFWDAVDPYLNDIDRIEVIRGPGAALWGANAVNGVINIITKSAKDTQGIQVEAGGGTEQRAFGGVREGLKVGESGYARWYAKGFRRDASVRPDGSDSIDGQRQYQGGFRVDSPLGSQADLTFSGDYYRGREPATRLDPATLTPTKQGVGDAAVNGANIVTRLTYRTSERSELSVQAYYDHAHRDMPTTFEDQLDTGDLQLQHRYTLGEYQTLVYGAGYRYSREKDGRGSNLIQFDPASITLETYNAFFQDQVKLGQNGELTIGSKFEHYTFTSFAVQPSIRLGWMVGEHVFTWGSVSRAVRLPGRFDENLVYCPSTTLCIPLGNHAFKPEKVIAYEWGLRTWTDRSVSLDVATFVNRYSDHRSIETKSSPFGNGLQGYTYGGELALSWTVWPWLTVRPTYSLLKIDFRAAPGSTDTKTAVQREGDAPEHGAGLRIQVDPGHDLSAEGFLRYVDSVPTRKTPGYAELSMRVAWMAQRGLEFAVVGTDLLHHSHPETSQAEGSSPTSEVQRAVWADLTWTWR